MSYTPMIMQYLEIKAKYPESILFFRLGDFYEMFFEDAIVASAELEITLTGRDGGKSEKIPMCGIPHHAAENYISKLIQKGYKVAICEQVEDPAVAQGIVKREVVRVITPGTILEGSSLDEKSHNYLGALVLSNNIYGLAVADVSTGLFQCTEFSGSDRFRLLADEIARLRLAELVIPESIASDRLIDELIKENKISKTVLADRYFSEEESIGKLSQFLGDDWRKDLVDYSRAVNASGSLLWYLELTQMNNGCQIKQLEKYITSQYVLIDNASRKNLEITNSLRDGSRWGTLIWVLDRTKTAMGGRLIKNWLEQPLTDPGEINFRLDGVEELFGNIIIRDDLAKNLKHIYDMERLAGKAVFGTANARDLLSLNNSFNELPEIKVIVAKLGASIFQQTGQNIDSLEDISSYLEQAIIHDPPVSVREGQLIKDGFDSEVDRLRKIQREGRQMLADLELEERENSGIKSLKIGYNRIFGYYLEVTKSYINLVPDYFIRKQTLANAERYITPKLKEMEDLILSSEDRLIQLEYNLFVNIREKIACAIERIQNTSKAV
ncbi:MAG: DNA mismatch repair protein MutS, partial [Peptococcaceae bacterium]|nr:DNA mismatch repair protein MutS [Peptococcaceae bacterium]